jgi:Ca2+-binding RTX toxin-like protein
MRGKAASQQTEERMMSNTIAVTGDYGYTQYKIYSGLDAGSTLDASTASWKLASSPDAGAVNNRYPFLMDYAGPGTTLKGGTIYGEVSQVYDWTHIYNWPDGPYTNSVAVRVENSPGAIIQDWRITKPWDGIRVSYNSNNFVIEDVWISNARDDAIENDDVLSGTIRDSLIDNVFVGLSLGDGHIHGRDDNVVTLDGVLMRSKAYLYRGDVTHTSPIKMYLGADDVSPHLRFINTVMAIEDVDHKDYSRLQQAWDKTIESHGNVFLNLSDEPLPANYPKPPAGWTILQGQSARDYWEKARAEWIDRHDDTPIPTPEPTPTPTPQPTPVPAEKPTFSGTSYTGTDSNDTIIGNDLANKILAKNGDDVVKGGLGNDTIDAGNGADTVWGGAGNDVFVFSRDGDMDNSSKAVDIFMDFRHGIDKFDLRLIDASETTSGDQAFAFIGGAAFGSNKLGELRSVYDATKNITRIELNTDADATAEYAFHVNGRPSFAAADFIL